MNASTSMQRLLRTARCAAMGLALSVALPAHAAGAGPNDVPEETWDRPRSGQTLLAVPAVKRALTALADDPQARLVIRHASGGEPAGQAEELKAWLVAHAIAPERIDLRADRAAREPIQLDVTAAAKP